MIGGSGRGARLRGDSLTVSAQGIGCWRWCIGPNLGALASPARQEWRAVAWKTLTLGESDVGGVLFLLFYVY